MNLRMIKKILLNKIRNKIRIDSNNNIEIHPNAKLRGCDIIIKGENNSLIIESECNLRNMKIEIFGVNCVIFIGKGTTNTGKCKLSCRENKTHLTIGENCLLANNVMILTSDGHDIYEDGKRVNHAASVEIKNHVWLAENVMILKGVSIEENCIIGANSVVTGKHEKNTLAAGSPARTIKKNISWDEQLTFSKIVFK